jgi:hypothetical protein
MTPAQIEKIINQGTAKQKTLLYHNSIALFVTGSEEGLLSEEQQKVLLEGINTPREVKFYNEIKSYTKVFILFNERYLASKNQFLRVQEGIARITSEKAIKKDMLEVLNSMLGEIKDREDRLSCCLLGVGLLRKKGLGSSYMTKDKEPVIVIPELTDSTALENVVEQFNATALDCKQYIEALGYIKSYLPFKTYEKYIRNEIKLLTDCIADWTKIKGITPYPELIIELSEEDKKEILNNRFL